MASVLKQDVFSQGGNHPQPVAFNIEDVQGRARDYLQQIQQQADAILADANQQAEQIRAEAKQQGLADAQQEVGQRVERSAQKLSDERCRTAVAACEAAVSRLAADTSAWLATWRNQTVELAANIAEKLVRREMRDDNEMLRVWMEEALVSWRDARDVRVLVHPDDFSVAGRFLQQLSKSVPQAVGVEVLPDPEVQLGGCVVRSSHGQIDQQLETQLQRLVEQLG